MIAWYHLLWIIPVALFVGGELTSFFELKKGYNLTDEEIDLVKGLWQKLTLAERAVLAKFDAIKKAI